MRVVLRPASATGGSSTNCHSACGRFSRKVLFGVRRNSWGGGPWPGTGRLQPGASATIGKAARARRRRRRWRPPTPFPRRICCVTTLLSSKALLCLIALLLVAEDEPGRVALHLGGDAVKNHNQLARPEEHT